MLQQLQKEDPRTTWVEKRYVRDGKLWTSGALLNGLDLMRDFAIEYWPELANVVIPLGGWPERSVDY
jgi:transcriptional regulator GlxA family with amidase domain